MSELSFKTKLVERYYFDNPTEFQDDVISEVGLTGHPLANKAFYMAWEQGHAIGHNDVYLILDDLADLIKEMSHVYLITYRSKTDDNDQDIESVYFTEEAAKRDLPVYEREEGEEYEFFIEGPKKLNT